MVWLFQNRCSFCSFLERFCSILDEPFCTSCAFGSLFAFCCVCHSTKCATVTFLLWLFIQKSAYWEQVIDSFVALRALVGCNGERGFGKFGVEGFCTLWELC